MTELAPFICGPCRADQHTSCRGPEWACECPHARALATAPAAASPRPARVDAAAGGAAEASWGSGVPAAPVATSVSAPAGADVASFSRPDWWGEHGCRHAGVEGHVCLDSFGRPVVAGGSPCVAEARAAMADLFDRYRAVAG